MEKILCVWLCLVGAVAFSQDLIVSNYAGPTTFSRYEEFSPDITVANTGIVGINKYFYAAAYLSIDDQWQASDISVESIYTGSLGAGQSFTGKPYRGVIDAPPGTYYLILKADHTNRITETDESNNLLTIPGIIVSPPDVDFTFTSFSLDKSVYTQNTLIKPSYILKNLGTTNTGGFVDIQFALSKDANFSQDDQLFDPRGEILTGPDNFVSNPYLTFALPTVSNGSYYILAWIDYDYFGTSQFEETNESNNFIATPITIQSSTADLQIIYTSSTYNSGRLSSDIGIRNNGSTGVAGYTIGAQLFSQAPGSYYHSCDYLAKDESYIGPGEMKVFFLNFNLYENTPGTYYTSFKVNDQDNVIESNISNNIHNDYSTQITIAPPPAPGVRLNSVSASGIVDNTDQQINLNLNLTNSGNTTGFNQNYTILIKNAQNQTVHSQQTNVAINFAAGQTTNKAVTLNLSSGLPVGSYQISVSCTSSCYTTPSLVSGNLSVTPVQYTVAGSVQAENGQPITKGKLFLYQNDGSGNARFIQKLVPYVGPNFSFNIDTNPHTLYFVPDPVQYPEYVPTIYGKTLTLQPSNFFEASSNMNVIVEVLKLNSLTAGTGIINGYATAGGAAAKSSQSQPLTLSTSAIPVILIASDGKVAGITYTDQYGFYEFKNLSRESYQIMLGFELDSPQVMIPFDVDITDKNMTVNLDVSDNGVDPAASQLFLPQIISFSELPTCQYGDAPISLDAQSDSALPVEYFSSDNGVANIVDGEVVIKKAGTVVITARQPGNNFYRPASVNRALTIDKASQSITMDPIAVKTFGDAPFPIESTSSAGLLVNLLSSDPTVATISDNTITMHRAGTVQITAEQTGNDFYLQASINNVLTINKASQSVTLNSSTIKNFGDSPFSIEGISSVGLPVNVLSSDPNIASVSGNTINIHNVGVVEITAEQPGNDSYLPASLKGVLTINKGNQTVTMSMSPLAVKTFGDAPFSIASVSSAGLPVNLSSYDPTVASVTGNTITIHKAGTVEITAEQPGNNLYSAALPVTERLTIEKAAQTISFEVLPEQTSDATSYILSATSTSGLDVSFESSDEEIVSIDGNIAIIHKDGVVNITAHQAGDQNYSAAEVVLRPLSIQVVLSVAETYLAKHIFPNPTSDFVFVEIPAITYVEVYDILGRTRSDVTREDNKIDFSQAEPGVYFVKVSIKNRSTVTRVIKK